MKYQYDGKFWLVFTDGMQYEIEKDLWERLRKLHESEEK